MLITGDFIRNMHLGSQASRSPKSKIARIMAQLSHGREPIVPPHPPAQHPSRSWGCQFIADDVKNGVLSETDRKALAPIARETGSRFPAEQAAK